MSYTDLWEVLTFGQYMYAGMKEEYGIDLNKALVKRTEKNMATGLTPLGEPDDFPYDIPAPKRCRACSRVVVEDLDPLSPRRPWNYDFVDGWNRLTEDPSAPTGIRGFGPVPAGIKPKSTFTFSGRVWILIKMHGA